MIVWTGAELLAKWVLEMHVEPKISYLLGLALGLKFPRLLPRMAVLNYEMDYKNDPDLWDEDDSKATFTLFCLDTQEQVEVVVRGKGQVERLHRFFKNARKVAAK